MSAAAIPSRVMEPAVFNPASGRLDAARFAAELKIPVTTVASALGRKAPGVRKHPDADSLQDGLRRLYRIYSSILELYDGDKSSARIFLNAPNRHLENRAPMEFIESGELAGLESLLEAMIARQPL